MSDDTTQAGGASGEPPRERPQDPAEGADAEVPNEPRTHPQDPAEGADDDSATG